MLNHRIFETSYPPTHPSWPMPAKTVDTFILPPPSIGWQVHPQFQIWNTSDAPAGRLLGRWQTVHEFCTNTRMAFRKFVYSWGIRGWWRRARVPWPLPGFRFGIATSPSASPRG